MNPAGWLIAFADSDGWTAVSVGLSDK
jgi:hypothetical protein